MRACACERSDSSELPQLTSSLRSFSPVVPLLFLITHTGNNVYGPHQYPEKLIPKFSMRLMRDMPLCIHGDGSNTRNYLYATDAAAAFDTILHKGVVGEVYNVGSPDEISNLDVATTLLEVFGMADREEMLTFVVDRPFNDLRYPLERCKLAELGWEPEVGWKEGLRQTVEWYKTNGGNWGSCDSALVAHPRRGATLTAEAPPGHGGTPPLSSPAHS